MFGFVDQDARAKNIIWEQKDHTGTSVFENNLVASLGLDRKVREQTGSPHSKDKHLLNLKRNRRKTIWKLNMAFQREYCFYLHQGEQSPPFIFKSVSGETGQSD